MVEYILLFCVAVGVVFVAWCLAGLLLSPVFGKGMVTFCYVQGDGAGLEQTVRSYGWLREGRENGGRLVLVDCGLTEQGLELAQVLRERHGWVDYCPQQALVDYIELTEF